MAQGLIKKSASATKGASQQKRDLGKTKRGAGTITETEKQMAAKLCHGKLRIMKSLGEKGLKDIVADKKKKGLIRAEEAKKMNAALAARPSAGKK
ncbi:hypothetical protein BCR33DRAFT_782172 [Rhizoclosmatium globosum]|uniref:Uncharacterized protein n=1 Tax=Rhizoclosmatium globosum TaxID=329046 RepID=A0A1Y2CN32_9FUNG|nr:hypothetical protein BCR33DRAFT_782172 [Rhizoclosmatium globosum]|eukprot:ORY48441.1 hypothetical protein BCR33DRAFT_782172 [Rhizoclosmatium globosum]